MTAGCLRIVAGKRMSVEEQEEEAVKYCNTADADCDCCCDAASYSSSSNSYCNCIAWRQLLHTPATAITHLPFPVSRFLVWSTLRNTSARSYGAKLSQESDVFTPIVSDHPLFWWSYYIPPIRWFQWLGGQDNIMVSESTAFSKAIMSIVSIDRHQSSHHMSPKLCLQPPKVSTASN